MSSFNRVLRRVAHRSRAVAVTLGLAAAVIAVPPAPAQAASLQTWTLSGVTFDDGGTASGWFEVGSDGTVRRWSLSVSGGDSVAYPPVTFSSDSTATPGDQALTFEGDAVYFTKTPPGSGLNRYMRLFSPGLYGEASTRTAELGSGQSWDCLNCTPRRFVTSGSLVGTPTETLPQEITFAAAPDAVIGGTRTPSASGGASGAPVTFSVDPATTNGACTFADGVVTYVHAGTCVIAADQAGNEYYSAAPTATQSVVVPRLAQSLTQIAAPAGVVRVGDPAVLVGFTGGGSGNAVTYALGDGTTNDACTLDGPAGGDVRVLPQHAGTCVVSAAQAGDADHEAGASSATFAVAKRLQVVAITSTAPALPALHSTYAPATSAGASSNPVVLSVDPSTTFDACSIAAGVVTFDHAGTCVIAADQAGDADHDAAPQVTQAIAVGTAAQAVTISSTPPVAPRLGSTYSPATTSGASGNPVVLSVDPSTTHDACSVMAGVVTFKHAGTCVVAANQAGDADHDAAPQVTQSIVVERNAQELAITSTAPAKPVYGDTYVVRVTPGGSSKDVVLGAEGACSITGATVTFGAAGTCVVRATQAGDDDYVDAVAQVRTITVATGAAPTVSPTLSSARAAGAGNWYSSAVVVSATCAAGAAPVSSCSADQVVTDEGRTRVTVTVGSADGLAASASRKVKIDRTKPEPHLAFIKRQLPRDKDVASRPCRGVDSLSGESTCQAVWHKTGSSWNSWRFKARVTDKAGNSRIVRGTLHEVDCAQDVRRPKGCGGGPVL